MRNLRGLVSIRLAFGLVLMAIALPIAGKLALNNQDIRNRAAGAHPPNCTCTNGEFTGTGCVALGYKCGDPTVVVGGSCLVDGTGTCSTNRPPGSECSVGSMCASKKCINGRCDDVNPTVVVGGSCLVDGTGTCSTNRPPGSVCTVDSMCANGRCISGKCVALTLTSAAGRTCTSLVSGMCGPGYHCKLFKCTPDVSIGGTCVFDNDCASKHCIGNTPNRRCASSENNRPVGWDCILPSVCASGRCISGKCVAKVIDGECTYDSDCVSNNCSGRVGTSTRRCEDKKKAGEVCISNGECLSNRCRKTRCQ